MHALMSAKMSICFKTKAVLVLSHPDRPWSPEGCAWAPRLALKFLLCLLTTKHTFFESGLYIPLDNINKI